MNDRSRVIPMSVLVAVLLACGSITAADIDVAALTQETQRTSRKSDEITVVWWMPEEFWAASLAQAPGMTPAQASQFLDVLRPYTMVAVVDGTMGAMGGITYDTEASIRANTRLVDSQGHAYVPLTEDAIDADTKNLLQMIKPVLSNMLGSMGENLHFLLFPARTAGGAPIASARASGHFTVKLKRNEFKWRLPLDSVLPVRVCDGCGQECKGSWRFCPWCGKPLASK